MLRAFSCFRQQFASSSCEVRGKFFNFTFSSVGFSMGGRVQTFLMSERTSFTNFKSANELMSPLLHSSLGRHLWPGCSRSRRSAARRGRTKGFHWSLCFFGRSPNPTKRVWPVLMPNWSGQSRQCQIEASKDINNWRDAPKGITKTDMMRHYSCFSCRRARFQLVGWVSTRLEKKSCASSKWRCELHVSLNCSRVTLLTPNITMVFERLLSSS